MPTKTLEDMTEEVISYYTTWLNRWHAASGDDDLFVTRSMYDECDDPPQVLAFVHYAGHLTENRTLVMRVSPYHDEGGPAILTALFSRYDPWQDWNLDAILQDFDTIKQLIFANEKLLNQPKETE